MDLFSKDRGENKTYLSCHHLGFHHPFDVCSMCWSSTFINRWKKIRHHQKRGITAQNTSPHRWNHLIFSPSLSNPAEPRRSLRDSSGVGGRMESSKSLNWTNVSQTETPWLYQMKRLSVLLHQEISRQYHCRDFFVCSKDVGGSSRDGMMDLLILTTKTKWVAGWWLNQPIWKIWVKLDPSSPSRAENKTFLKPPPRWLIIMVIYKSPLVWSFPFEMGGRKKMGVMGLLTAYPPWVAMFLFGGVWIGSWWDQLGKKRALKNKSKFSPNKGEIMKASFLLRNGFQCLEMAHL